VVDYGVSNFDGSRDLLLLTRFPGAPLHPCPCSQEYIKSTVCKRGKIYICTRYGAVIFTSTLYMDACMWACPIHVSYVNILLCNIPFNCIYGRWCFRGHPIHVPSQPYIHKEGPDKGKWAARPGLNRWSPARFGPGPLGTIRKLGRPFKSMDSFPCRSLTRYGSK
jgi:hypothetical protein